MASSSASSSAWASSSSSASSSLSSVPTPACRRTRALYEFGNAFAYGKKPDFIIECGDEIWKIHTSVVCSRSAYFTAACRQRSKGGKNRRIILNDEDPFPISLMLRYLYFGDYSVPPPKSNDGAASVPGCLEIHCKMLAVGKKYRLTGLEDLALDKFIAGATDPNTWRLLPNQQSVNLLPLDQLPKLVSALAAAYISPEDRQRMRSHVMPHVMRNLALLPLVPEFAELKRLCKGFQSDLREEMASAWDNRRRAIALLGEDEDMVL